MKNLSLALISAYAYAKTNLFDVSSFDENPDVFGPLIDNEFMMGEDPILDKDMIMGKPLYESKHI